MPKPQTREDVIDAITQHDATKATAGRAELQLSRVLRAVYGGDGTTYGRRRLRPTANGKVATEWLETDPAKPTEPALTIEED